MSELLSESRILIVYDEPKHSLIQSPRFVRFMLTGNSQRIARFLTRKGLLAEDTENSYLALEGLEEGSMQQFLPCFKVA